MRALSLKRSSLTPDRESRGPYQPGGWAGRPFAGPACAHSPGSIPLEGSRELAGQGASGVPAGSMFSLMNVTEGSGGRSFRVHSLSAPGRLCLGTVKKSAIGISAIIVRWDTGRSTASHVAAAVPNGQVR